MKQRAEAAQAQAEAAEAEAEAAQAAEKTAWEEWGDVKRRQKCRQFRP